MKKIQLSGFNTSEIIKKIYLKELASTTDKEYLNKKALMYGLNPKDLQEIAKSESKEIDLTIYEPEKWFNYDVDCQEQYVSIYKIRKARNSK